MLKNCQCRISERVVVLCKTKKEAHAKTQPSIVKIKFYGQDKTENNKVFIYIYSH